jgi:hypothetical protein
MPRAYAPTKDYAEWSQEAWEAALNAANEAISLLKEHKLKRLRIGKPFDIEIEVSD